MSCIFCDIVAGRLDCNIIYRDDDLIVFPDINLQAPVHLLIIPQRHIESLESIKPSDETLIGKMFSQAQAQAKAHGLNSGFRTVFNSGQDGGQTVFHLHLHLLGGRPMQWPPG